jgi:alkanesulfonate monooxygenase SsuD/methylene tetrahydromethanopterin reductase-like flavin-dependent oxidoreductase (luciferase family)
MKVNIAVFSNNATDWDRIEAKRFDEAPSPPDGVTVSEALSLGDLAEPLGFDGIWCPDHFGTPYGMSPNPLQVLSYFAGRTERVNFGTMVIVLPWWNPVQVAHQIAYLDILSNGRFNTIGFGRGVAKTEFEALNIPREEARQRFAEGIDIIGLALSTGRFSYEGEIWKIPEMSLRPQPVSENLMSCLYGASSTGASLEILARRGIKPLFVGNKPMQEAAQDVRKVNVIRAEEGMAPCQSKNILFTYCVADERGVEDAERFLTEANREVRLHYGFDDRSQFEGVKGYEDYASGEGTATAVTDEEGRRKTGTGNVYDQSNLLIGTPETIIERISTGQKLCSFEEITLATRFGSMSVEEAKASMRLFSEEVLPVVHEMKTPLNPSALP